jgi:hypothetical protein
VVFNDDLSLSTVNQMLLSTMMECTECIEQIMKIAPAKVVYVSCNSAATQARDLALMDESTK